MRGYTASGRCDPAYVGGLALFFPCDSCLRTGIFPAFDLDFLSFISSCHLWWRSYWADSQIFSL